MNKSLAIILLISLGLNSCSISGLDFLNDNNLDEIIFMDPSDYADIDDFHFRTYFQEHFKEDYPSLDLKYLNFFGNYDNEDGEIIGFAIASKGQKVNDNYVEGFGTNDEGNEILNYEDRFNRRNALFFDGMSFRSHQQTGRFVTEEFTFSIWVNLSDLEKIQPIFSYGSNGVYHTLSFETNQIRQSLIFESSEDLISYEIADKSEFISKWNCIGITRSGNLLRLYINGQLAKEEKVLNDRPRYSAITDVFVNEDQNKLILGGFESNNNEKKFFRGIIDEFIWYRELKSHKEMLNLSLVERKR